MYIRYILPKCINGIQNHLDNFIGLYPVELNIQDMA